MVQRGDQEHGLCSQAWLHSYHVLLSEQVSYSMCDSVSLSVKWGNNNTYLIAHSEQTCEKWMDQCLCRGKHWEQRSKWAESCLLGTHPKAAYLSDLTQEFPNPSRFAVGASGLLLQLLLVSCRNVRFLNLCILYKRQCYFLYVNSFCSVSPHIFKIILLIFEHARSY